MLLKAFITPGIGLNRIQAVHFHERSMKNLHMKIKSHKKGQATDRAKYITRTGKYEHYADDLVETGFGNLPAAADGDPNKLWASADKHERDNGSASREIEASLPNALSTEDQVAIVKEYIEQTGFGRPYQFAIHRPIGKLSQEDNSHFHLIYSDRLQDGIERPLDQMFRRYNPSAPENGGCKKGSGGKSPTTLRSEVQAKRKLMADIINAKMEERGLSERVDHRSLKDQGIKRAPERYLGPGKVKNMTVEEKEAFVKERSAKKL